MFLSMPPFPSPQPSPQGEGEPLSVSGSASGGIGRSESRRTGFCAGLRAVAHSYSFCGGVFFIGGGFELANGEKEAFVSGAFAEVTRDGVAEGRENLGSPFRRLDRA